MEQQVEVEIVTETITAQYGTLTVGAILRTGTSYAAHLVNDHAAARYVSAKHITTEFVPVTEQEGSVQTSAQDEVPASEQAGAQGEQTGPKSTTPPTPRKRSKAASTDGGDS